MEDACVTALNALDIILAIKRFSESHWSGPHCPYTSNLTRGILVTSALFFKPVYFQSVSERKHCANTERKGNISALTAGRSCFRWASLILFLSACHLSWILYWFEFQWGSERDKYFIYVNPQWQKPDELHKQHPLPHQPSAPWPHSLHHLLLSLWHTINYSHFTATFYEIIASIVMN